MSRRRVRAIVRKELREIRHNRSLLVGMAILPLLFLIQPLVAVFAAPSGSAGRLGHENELVYLLGVPALMPALLAAYAVVGERLQGTLEPLLTTPIRRKELLAGKALAVLGPAVAVSYVVFGLFLAAVALFARPGVAPALIRGPDVAAQLLLTPLVVGWSMWLAMTISARAGDIRVAQQLSLLAAAPTVVIAALVAFGAIPASPRLAAGLAAALLVLNGVGRRMAAAAFDRERLVASA